MNFLNNSKWLIALVLLVGLLAFFSRNENSGATKLGKVERGEVAQRVTVAGVVFPNKQSIITAPFNGYIQKIFVKVGQKVQQGDPLFSLSQSLQNPEKNHPLRAPFAGTVVQVEKSEGEYAKENDLKEFIVRIDDNSSYFVLAEAPEIEAVRLKVGQAAKIKASALLQRTYNGIVKELALAAKTQENNWRNNQQVVFKIKIEITDPDENLRAGMSVLVDVIADRRENVLFLAHQYINREKDQYFVITKDEEKKFIKVGLQNESVFEITEGLAENEEVQAIDFLKLSEEQDGSK